MSLKKYLLYGVNVLETVKNEWCILPSIKTGISPLLSLGSAFYYDHKKDKRGFLHNPKPTTSVLPSFYSETFLLFG